MRSLHPMKSYRIKVGISIDAFAKLAGVSKATISRIENGTQNPSLNLIRRIVERTELKAEDFLVRMPQRAARGGVSGTT